MLTWRGFTKPFNMFVHEIMCALVVCNFKATNYEYLYIPFKMYTYVCTYIYFIHMIAFISFCSLTDKPDLITSSRICPEPCGLRFQAPDMYIWVARGLSPRVALGFSVHPICCMLRLPCRLGEQPVQAFVLLCILSVPN